MEYISPQIISEVAQVPISSGYWATFLLSPFTISAISFFLGVVVSLAVFIINRRFELGSKSYREMVYLERLCNYYINNFYTAKIEINRFVQGHAVGKFAHLNLESLPVREESLMNILDLELVREWFLITIDVGRLNSDYKMFTEWNQSIRLQLPREGMQITEEILEHKNGLEAFSIALDKMERKLLTFMSKNNVKLQHWKSKCWFDVSNIHDLSFYRLLVNHLLQPTIPVTDIELQNEKSSLYKELETNEIKSHEEWIK